MRHSRAGVIGIALAGAMCLAGLMLLGGFKAGLFAWSAPACDFAGNLCTLTPTATEPPTATPTATATSRPTATPTATPSPTSTPTPLPYTLLLEGCRDDDFDFAVKQLAPATQSRVTNANVISGLVTEFALINTGHCYLIEALVVARDDLATPVVVAPFLISPGQEIALNYAWSPLPAGRHTATLLVTARDSAGRYQVVAERAFELEIELTLTRPVAPTPIPTSTATPTLTPTPVPQCCRDEPVYCTRKNCTTDPGTGRVICTEERYVCGSEQVCGPCP